MRERISVLLCGLFFLSFPTLLPGANARAVEPQRDWTLLVYLNGDNSLDSFGPINLKQMETVGSTNNVNVVVQWASIANAKTERLFIQKSSDPTNITSPVVQDMGAVDMGDWHTLVDFIEWGAKNYPAKHYFVDVWDHGSGWHSIEVMNSHGHNVFHPTDISWDDNTGHSITTQQLGQAIGQASQAIGQKIDIYGSDACLMGMIEVAGEMKDSVNYFVGSQEVEPGAGWPYDKLLQDWNAKPDMSAKDVASTLAEEYANLYNSGSQQSDATMAVYDLSHQDDMEKAIADLGSEITKLGSSDLKKVATAVSNTQAFTDNDYGDLADFLKQMGQSDVRVPDTAVNAVLAAFSSYVVANHVTDSFAGKANGLSIWLPKSQSDYSSNSTNYETMGFETRTRWGDALKAMLPALSTMHQDDSIPNALSLP